MNIYQTDDFNLIKKIDKDIFGKDYSFHNRKNRRWWILKEGDNIVGYCGLELKNNKEAFLFRCGLYDKYQGLGLQKKMIRVRERYCRKNNIKRIVTYVYRKNLPSINNLIACKYRVYNPETTWGLPKKEAIYFYKNL